MEQGHVAFSTWDTKGSMERAEIEIHDGYPLSELPRRAKESIERLTKYFPHAHPKIGERAMEVGSGLAYLMQEVRSRFGCDVLGLDVAPNMVEFAKKRLARDQVPPFEFMLYDGIEIPVPSNSFDFVYSHSSIQHIPKHYAYNLFWEIQRILKPGGHACLHVNSVSLLPRHPCISGHEKGTDATD